MAQYKENIPLPDEIELDAIVNLKNQLKSYSLTWVADLAEKMFPRSEGMIRRNMENKKGKTKVNNIVSGGIANNASRVAFIMKGTELLKEYQDKQAEALQLVQKHQLTN